MYCMLCSVQRAMCRFAQRERGKARPEEEREFFKTLIRVHYTSVTQPKCTFIFHNDTPLISSTMQLSTCNRSYIYIYSIARNVGATFVKEGKGTWHNASYTLNFFFQVGKGKKSKSKIEVCSCWGLWNMAVLVVRLNASGIFDPCTHTPGKQPSVDVPFYLLVQQHS